MIKLSEDLKTRIVVSLTSDSAGEELINAVQNENSSGVSSLNALSGTLNITAGSGISVVPSGSNIQISAIGGGSGTVTSVALTAPSLFGVAGSPVTTSGTLALSLNAQSANTVFAGPTTGLDAIPTFRALTPADIPSLPYMTSVTLTDDITGTGTSSVSATLKEAVSKRYVDFLNGNDAGTGSLVQPWKTLSHAYTAVTDASINKPYVFYLSGGNNDSDTSVTAKPNISLIADYQIQVASGGFTISGGTTNDGCSFTNIIFTGAFSWVRNDSSVIGVNFNNCAFFSGPTVRQTGAGSVSVQAIQSVFVNSDWQLQSYGVFSDCTFLGTTTFEDGGNFNYYEFLGGYNSSAMTINGGVDLAYFAGFIQDLAFGASMTFTTTGSGTPNVQFDSGSLTPTYTGTPNLTYSSHSQLESYTPSDATKWANPQPTTVKEALDRIAAVVGLSTPIP